MGSLVPIVGPTPTDINPGRALKAACATLMLGGMTGMTGMTEMTRTGRTVVDIVSTVVADA